MVQGKSIRTLLMPALLLAAALFTAASLRAADETSSASTQPSTDMPMAHHGRKLFAPFGLLSDLSDDQKSQLEKIHTEYLAQEKALRDKQDSDAMALLTPEQKTELAKVMDEETAGKKEKSAERRKKKMMEEATTMPAR